MHSRPQKAIRWHVCLNTEDEAIPPFACMELDDSDADTLSSVEKDAEGRAVFRVKKPTAEGVASGSSARFVFNGPFGIPAGIRGQCTFDVPVQALLGPNPDLEAAAGGRDYSPVEGEWYIEAGGGGFFKLIAEDKTEPLGEDHTVGWVMRAGGGRGGLTIRFRVITAHPESRSVTATIIAVPYGMTREEMPGQFVAGNVFICDPNGCYFNETGGELLGRDGWAEYMQPLDGHAGPCQEYPYAPDPQWEVKALCCPLPGCDE